jgi:uncharacterized protein (TIGR03067 family)
VSAFHEAPGYCPACRRDVLIRAGGINHVPHLLATIFLLGIWLVVWMVLCFVWRPRWLCTRCGQPCDGPPNHLRLYAGIALALIATPTIVMALVAGIAFMAALRQPETVPQPAEQQPIVMPEPDEPLPAPPVQPTIPLTPPKPTAPPPPPTPQRRPDEEVRAELLARLAGAWRLVSRVADGRTSSAGIGTVWRFAGDRLTIGGQAPNAVRVEPTAGEPRLEVSAPAAGRSEVLYRCIFRFDGPRLVVCAGVGSKYPTAYRAGASDPAVLLTFARVPDPPAAPPPVPEVVRGVAKPRYGVAAVWNTKPRPPATKTIERGVTLGRSQKVLGEYFLAGEPARRQFRKDGEVIVLDRPLEVIVETTVGGYAYVRAAGGEYDRRLLILPARYVK